MSTNFGNNKCQRQSTSHLSPRAGCTNANNSPFSSSSSSPPSSSSSQSPSPPRRRDVIRNAVVNAIRSRPARSSTTAVPQFRGVRHREELNKYVSEIRPTRCAKKIWLGTYDTAEEAARAFDIGNLCCKKNIPLNFADSPAMMHRLPRISSQLSPEDARSAIANLAKECARLQKSGAVLPGSSYLCASEVIATPVPPFNSQPAMAQPAQNFWNQNQNNWNQNFSDFTSVEQYDQIQQVCPPQQPHFDSRIHNYATGSRSEIFFEQLPEQVCPVTELVTDLATAVPMTMRDGDGSRSWEFDVYCKIPSDKSLPDADIPVLTEAPLDAIDNHIFEEYLYPDQVRMFEHFQNYTAL